jgi:NAD(P)-dependent dehydrogenase (short-subunit alcohol dehydrogenase family)
MTIDLTNKVAFVTGASKGIGRSVAETLARCGANVGIMARNLEEVQAVAAAITAAGGGRVIGLAGDVANPAEVEAAVQQTVAAFGHLDLAVNNAGILGDAALLHECTPENWRRIFATNVDGCFYSMKYEIIEMLKTGGGSIVNIASVEAHAPLRSHAAYTTSKHALIGLTTNTALDYADKGIRINSVSPGVIRTPLVEGLGNAFVSQLEASIPVGRLGTGDEVANTVAFLLSDWSAYTTSSDFLVDGAFVVRGLFRE